MVIGKFAQYNINPKEEILDQSSQLILLNIWDVY